MIDRLLQGFTDAFASAQQLLFESVVQPLAFVLGFGNVVEDAYAATGWLLVGVLQLVVMLLVFRALERWRPVEAVTDRAAVRVDVVYTLIHRLGLFRLALFFSIDPLWDMLFGALSYQGLSAWQLDAWLAPAWPGLTDTAWFAFLAYLLVFDFIDYWLHRAQHAVPPWWSLHALHHSQRQMTMWSDNRNHLLDDLIRDSVLVLAARLIGIAPGQFVAVVACTQLLESLSHANVRLWFGPVFERVLVSPRFHRLHHSIGLGHESQGRGTLGGHNFAVLFPIWDVLFRTANFERRFDPTGIRDQLPEEGARDYGRGFWAQQWRGLARLSGAAERARVSSAPMKSLFDSAWRAAAYCAHPQVIFLSLLPLLLIAGLAFGVGYFFWEPALDAVSNAFSSWELLSALFKWLDSIGMGRLRAFLVPLVVVLLATPVLVVLSLLSVALLMVPAMLKLVARRRFPALQERQGGSFAGSLFVSLSSTLMALVALVISIPFWLIPPVVLVVPPLIWGWLTYRVMSYDMLAEHASKEERRQLLSRHRPSLLLMGVVTGYLGAAPSLVWVTGVMFIPLAPVLVPVAIWIYTLVFAFSALWFAHYTLSALQALRAETGALVVPAAPAIDIPETSLPLPPL